MAHEWTEAERMLVWGFVGGNLWGWCCVWICRRPRSP